ncbi:MAG: response regulator [candidate division Zixibacteria bacterium]|nr:response regulator [candidate division Zixibacteria bacterium]
MNAARKTVLVVDDEADVRNFLRIALLEAGFEVVTASDGFEALEQVKKQVPDLISLDLVMPKKSGAKFHRELTRNREWAKIPVIIVTGHARDDLGKADLKELTMSGPGVYLEKPVKPDNYVAAIKQMLGMDTTEEESELAEQVELQSDLKNMIDEADPDTLRKLRDMLRKSDKE